jgi:hypothetical protein
VLPPIGLLALPAVALLALPALPLGPFAVLFAFGCEQFKHIRIEVEAVPTKMSERERWADV